MNQSSLWMLKRADLPGGLFPFKALDERTSNECYHALSPPLEDEDKLKSSKYYTYIPCLHITKAVQRMYDKPN